MSRDKLRVYREDEVAATYDRRWRGERGRARNLRKQRAIELALRRFPAARTVLDVPCGTGRFTGFLSGRGLDYLGGDAAVAMLLEARGKHPAAPLVACDLTRLPLPDSSVDVAVCIRLLHLVRDPQLRLAFLRELARVARLGVIVDYRHDRSLRVVLARLRARLGLRKRAPGALPPALIRAEVDAAGLALAAWIPVRRVPWLSEKVVLAAAPRGR